MEEIRFYKYILKLQSNINSINSVLMKYSIFCHTELVSVSYKFDKILKQVQNDKTYIFVNHFNNRTQIIKKIF